MEYNETLYYKSLGILLIDRRLKENSGTWRTEVKDKIERNWIEPLLEMEVIESLALWTLSLPIKGL